MSDEPIPFDIDAVIEERTAAIMQALLTGQPLAATASTRPDVPSVGIGLELSRATAETETEMVAIDGRDALFFLIVRPGPGSTPPGGPSVLLEHGGSGISQGQAAYILRQVADRLDAAEKAAAAAWPPRGGHGGLCAYAAGFSRTCTCQSG